MILCDTNILIEFYKGSPAVVDALRAIGLPDLSVSVITVGELYFGVKNKRELHTIQNHLSLLHQLALNKEISSMFLNLLEYYSLSHRISIPDALIAATALIYKIPLYTLNAKDFRYIKGLTLFKS